MARKDKLIQEYVHDPYVAKTKYADPSVCDTCGVAFSNGIFAWLQPPPDAASMRCPACRRIADKYEGGVVNLEGEFMLEHKPEIMNTIRNVETEAKRQRPLDRIIEVKEEPRQTIITTTYEHLAKKIGNALHRAYKGDLKTQFLEGEKYVRVWWNR